MTRSLTTEYRLTTLPEPLAAARLKLTKPSGRPYLASALWALQPCGVPGLARFMAGPIAVDARWRLIFDPEFAWETLPVDQLSAILYHEISHLLRQHPARAAALHADAVLVSKSSGAAVSAWNVAADFEINPSITKDGATLPEWAAMPKMMDLPDGLLAEEYYERILKKVPQGAAGGAAAGACGGCATGDGNGDDREGEKRATAGPGVGTAEGELIRRRVAQDVAEAAKSRGDVPGWLRRWADEVLTPRVDWRRTLQVQVRRAVAEIAGMVDYTYRRPSRRQAIYGDVVMPALRAPRVSAAFVLDTSGSMSGTELAQGIAEAAGIIRTLGASIAYYAVDAAVAAAKRVATPRDIVLAGGGGTDMRVGITAALAAKPRPDCVVVFTDGQTPWPEADPGVPVIVCLSAEAQPPTWARVVRAF